MKDDTVTVVLACPKCHTTKEFLSSDFEDWVECEKCRHGNEAWFFWHTPLTRRVFNMHNYGNMDLGIKSEVWSFGAHYPNDALVLDREEFERFFLGQGRGGIHGGSPYIWVERNYYNANNINNGLIEVEVRYDIDYGNPRQQKVRLSGKDMLANIGEMIDSFVKWLATQPMPMSELLTE